MVLFKNRMRFFSLFRFWARWTIVANVLHFGQNHKQPQPPPPGCFVFNIIWAKCVMKVSIKTLIRRKAAGSGFRTITNLQASPSRARSSYLPLAAPMSSSVKPLNSSTSSYSNRYIPVVCNIYLPSVADLDRIVYTYTSTYRKYNKIGQQLNWKQLFLLKLQYLPWFIAIYIYIYIYNCNIGTGVWNPQHWLPVYFIHENK